jgi:hypothetical protein
MDAHVVEYYEYLEAKDWEASCKAMLVNEARWVDNGCCYWE